MIIATETTNQSLKINLSDHTYLQAFVSAEENAKRLRAGAFKRDLEAFVCALAFCVSKALARPKGRTFDIDSSLMYLCIDIANDGELYGEMSYYFSDTKFESIDVGVRLYNKMVKKVAEAIECEYLKNYYFRIEPTDKKDPNEVKDVLKIGGIDVEVSILRACEIDADGDLYPKVYFEFFNNNDPKAMAKIELVDSVGKAKSRPIVFQLSGVPRTKKSYFYEIDTQSLGENSHAILGARIQISHRNVEVKNGKTITKVITDEGETLMDVYLKPRRSKK